MKAILNAYKKILFLLLTAIVFFCIYESHAANPPFPPNLAEENTLPTSVNVSIKTPEYVIIRANEESTFSSETTGRIIYLPVKEGSSFKKGDVLVKLDCRLQQAELTKAKAEQYAAEKALQSAKKLKIYGAISEFELIKAKADTETKNADVDKLLAIVEKCAIIAPFTGGVTEIKARLYETVSPGDPLLKVTNIKDLSIEVQVPSKWLSWLHIGSIFKVQVNDINQSIQGEITYINPAIEPISQTVKITGKILHPEMTLKPGMTGQAFFMDNPESNKGSDQ